MLWMGMVIMDSQNRKGALYQIVAFILAKPALLILAKLSTLVLVNSLQSFWRNALRSFSDGLSRVYVIILKWIYSGNSE